MPAKGPADPVSPVAGADDVRDRQGVACLMRTVAVNPNVTPMSAGGVIDRRSSGWGFYLVR